LVGTEKHSEHDRHIWTNGTTTGAKHRHTVEIVDDSARQRGS